MNRSERFFWKLTITSRERRELFFVALLLTVSMFLLNSSFNRVAEKTVIKVSELAVQKQLKG